MILAKITIVIIAAVITPPLPLPPEMLKAKRPL